MNGFARKNSSKKTTAREKPNALGKALSLLAVRDYSEAELAAKLNRCAFLPDEIESALRHCRECGYLDDCKFARERARMLIASGRAIGPRAIADLRRRGIDEQVARQAVEEASQSLDEENLLAGICEKRFAGFNFHMARDSEKKRVVNYFLRRGFSLSTVLKFLKGER